VTGPGRFQISHRRLRTDTHSRTRILDPGFSWYRAGRPALTQCRVLQAALQNALAKPISWRTQLWFIALGYAAVFAVAVGLLSARSLQELHHPADVAAYGGRYGGGDVLLGCAAHPWVNVHG
jgi:hypothetical protein